MAKKPNAEPEGELALDGGAPKKSKKKLIIIIISLLLLGALGGGGYYVYKGMGKKAAAGADNATEHKAEPPHAEAPAKDGHAEPKGDKKPEGAPGVPVDGAGELVSIPPFLVNLADPQGRRYLKLAMDVEVKDKAASDQLNKNMPKIKDALILLLSSKTYEDLASIENKILLKKEIVERLTLVLGEQKVQRVYITEIVIQ